MNLRFTNEAFKISSISFLTGKIICTDKAKTEFWAPRSMLVQLSSYAVDEKYIYFKLDGKIVVEYRLYESK